MVRIAIVDDDESQIASIREAIEDYGVKNNIVFTVDYFQSAYALDEDDHLYDILFLDVQMPSKDGMTYATEIRKRNQKIIICFTTSFAQYAVKGYEVDAVDYILKPINKSEFLVKFPRILRFLPKKEDRHINIKLKEGVRIVSLEDVIYVEASGHFLSYYLSNNEILESRYSLKELENDENFNGFFARCHAAYLINLHHVKSIKGNDVVVSNGKSIPISQSKKKQFILAMTKVK